eukprot:7681815-Pyramimonas_sp.AAC.1
MCDRSGSRTTSVVGGYVESQFGSHRACDGLAIHKASRHAQCTRKRHLFQTMLDNEVVPRCLGSLRHRPYSGGPEEGTLFVVEGLR